LPVVVVVVTGGLKRASLGPERAALSLGARPLQAFLATTFVAIRPSILTGALFAFLVSFDDVVIALFLAGLNSTLPKRMWDSVQLEIDPTVAAVSALLILLSIAVVLAWELIRLRLHGGEDGTGLVSGP
jgi:ABC-type spermidine/putrescine transport system permease subunit II